MPWSSDDDVDMAWALARELLRPGEIGFKRFRDAAEAALLLDLDLAWRRDAARERGVDFREHPIAPSRLEAGQMRRISVLKTLELLCGAAKKDATDDALANAETEYRRLGREELERLIRAGVDYDWDGLGLSSADRARKAPPPRLRRV